MFEFNPLCPSLPNSKSLVLSNPNPLFSYPSSFPPSSCGPTRLVSGPQSPSTQPPLFLSYEPLAISIPTTLNPSPISSSSSLSKLPLSNKNNFISCNSAEPLSSLSLRQLRKKYSKKAKRIPFNYNPTSSNDRLLLPSDSSSSSRVESGDVHSSATNKLIAATIPSQSNILSNDVDDKMIKDIVNLVSKSLDSKFNIIFSTLKEISDIMGVEIPVGDNTFVDIASKVIDGHAKGFEDI